MRIPYTINCKSREYIICDYFMSEECPETCNFAYRIRHNIPHSSKSGLERFKERYGKDWRMIADGEG